MVDGEFIVDSGNTAASAKARLGVSDLWLVDTGCGHGLVSANNAKLSKGKKINLENQVTFQTANGDAPSTHSSQIFIEELNEMDEPYILKDTPSVIPVGDRTMNKGCSFLWIAGRNPYSITPEAKVIALEVIGAIPYLRRNSEFCQPRDATASDYILPLVVGLPSIRDGAQDSNVDGAADSMIDPPASDAGEEDENTTKSSSRGEILEASPQAQARK